MITINYKGHLGNNLFQRVIAEIFADKHNLTIHDPLCSFTSTNSRTGGRGMPEALSLLINPSVDKILPKDELIKLGDEDVTSRTNYLKHLYNCNLKRLHLDGFFQKSWIYLEHREKIKSFVNTKKTTLSISPDDVAVCIRRNNVTGTEQHIPVEYYKYTINKYFKNNSLYIFTDSPNDKDIVYLQKLFNVKKIIGNDRPMFNAKEAVLDLSCISTFNNIIGGIGTYHWWAIFLSSAKNIFLPLAERGWGFTKGNSIDLYLPFVKYIHHCEYSY